MGLFGFGKKKEWDLARSNANKEKMKALFQHVVEDHNQFDIVYAYSTNIKSSNYILARKTTYTYTSLIVGFRKADMKIVILQTTPELEGCSDPEIFTKDSIKKAKMVQGGYTLYHKGGLMAGYTQFYLADENDEDYLAYVYQPEETMKWEEFWKEFSK